MRRSRGRVFGSVARTAVVVGGASLAANRLSHRRHHGHAGDRAETNGDSVAISKLREAPHSTRREFSPTRSSV
jgi:fatty acid desaturase